MFYNEERKNRFLESETLSKFAIVQSKSLFSKSRIYEEKVNRDICLFFNSEIDEFFQITYGGKSREYALRVVNVLEKYREWCDKQGFEISSDPISINMDNILKRNFDTAVASPKHLEIILDDCFRPIEMNYYDVAFRAYFWLAFCGVPYEQVGYITAQNVDFFDMVIRHNDYVYELPRESLPALRAACYSDSFTHYDRYGRMTNIQEREQGEAIVRLSMKKEVPIRRYDAFISKTSGDKCKINYNGVYRSGLFYRAYQLEQLGFTPNFKPAVLQAVLSDPKRTAPPTDIAIKKRIYSMKSEYRDWKTEFIK